MIEGRLLPALDAPRPADFRWEDVELWWSVPAAKRIQRLAQEDGSVRAVATWDGDRAVAWPREDGTFVLEDLPLGVPLGIELSDGPRFTPMVEIAALRPGERRWLELQLPGDWWEIRHHFGGRVLDQWGAPVAGARVTLVHESLDWTSVEAGDDGAFTHPGVASGTWTVHVSHQDVVPSEKLEIELRDDLEGLVLTVLRGGSIEGEVRWPDGRPVELLAVHPVGPESRWGGFRCQGGRFRLSGLQPGAHTLELLGAERGASGYARVEGAVTGSVLPIVVLARTPAFDVHGAVVDREGRPLDAEVSASQIGGEYGCARTEARDGSFVLQDLPLGEWRIRARSDGAHAAEQDVTVDASTPLLRFELEPSGWVSGVVLAPDGGPVAGVVIDGSARGTSDAHGRFTLRSTAAMMDLGAAKEGFTESERVHVTVGPGETVDGVVLRLRSACRLSGRLRGAHPELIAGAVLFVERSDESWALQVNEQGFFSREDLPPGPAEVVAVGSDEREARVRVVLDPSRPCEVELRLPR